MIPSSKKHYLDFRRRRKDQRTREDSPAPASAASELRDGSTAGDSHDGPDGAGRFDPAARKAKRRSYIREYASWLRPHRAEIVFILFLSIVSAVLSMVLPMATQYAVDDILLGSRDRRALMWFGAAMLVVTFLQHGVFTWRRWRQMILNARVVTRLRTRLYEHLLHLPLTKLSDLKSGGIVSRLSGDVDLLTQLLQIAIITPVIGILKVLITLGALVWINWRMALAGSLVIPPLVALNIIYLRRIRPIYRSMRDDREAIDGRVAETFGGIRVVRAFAREKGETRDYAVGHQAVVRKELFARIMELVVSFFWGILLPIMSLIVIWYGGLRYLAGDVTIGGIIAFQMYLAMLFQPVSAIVESYAQTQQVLAAMERVFDALREPRDLPDAEGAIEAPAPPSPPYQAPPHSPPYQGGGRGGFPCTIEFHDVWFEYRADRPVLRGVSLRAAPGQMIALVGPSGAGKTTITNLVARFYDPTRGSIRLNGVDLRDVRLKSYRRLLGMVTQDVFLFDGTVAENIAFSRHGVMREDIVEAARRANADAFIRELPEGYDTLVGERGVKLSGGQAQRVSIARAFLADPSILILDEATSNLDTESEELIQAGMAELIAHRTTFVIAHRLSTVKHADAILVIEDGEIVERGRHAELMAAGGVYCEMVERQMKLQRAEEAEAWLS